jgi:hypothetical protein
MIGLSNPLLNLDIDLLVDQRRAPIYSRLTRAAESEPTVYVDSAVAD